MEAGIRVELACDLALAGGECLHCMTSVKTPLSIGSPAPPSGKRASPFLTILAVVLAQSSLANPVAIQDASFDSRSLNPGAFSTTLTPWQETNGPGNGGGFVERINAFAGSGLNHLGMNLNHNVWQDLGVTYQPHTRYTLTVAVGNRNTTLTQSGNQSQYLLAASDGAIHATGTFNASTLAPGTFADAPPLVLETGARPPSSGTTIRILLQARGSGRSHFDNIRLTAVPKLVQTIAFAELDPVAMGDPAIALNATASSGLPVSFSSTNPSIASVSGNLLTIHSPGSVTITASQAGNGEFRPAAQVERVLIIYSGVKDPQLITFHPPASPQHGDEPVPLVATASSGLPVVFTSSNPAVASTAGGLLLARQPGTVVITAGQAGNAGFLAAAPVSHEITVLPGVLAVPGEVRHTVASGSADLSVEIPVGSRAGEALAWTAATGGAPAWLDLTTPEGSTPGPLRLLLSPVRARVGEQAAELWVSTGDSVFPITVILTVESAVPADVYELTGGGQAPATANAFSAAGREAYFELQHAPETGADIPVVRVTGSGFIEGTFGNLPQGARVDLPFGGRIYPFVVNYFGGDGNDLVLQWANVRLVAWGYNPYGQLGDGSRTNRLTPVAVAGQRLAGRTPLVVSAGGELLSMALAADGTAFSWGEGTGGRLGNGDLFTSTTPHPIKQNGELLGKTIATVAAGRSYGIALSSDGLPATWGDVNDQFASLPREPVVVNLSGVLAGKTVVAVSAGRNFRLALCSDGTLVSWGRSTYGALGTGNSESSDVPVAVVQSGVLAGKTVRAIATGDYHCLVLCDDGTLAAWGYNGDGLWGTHGEGQLGNGTSANSNLPVLVNRSGVLAGRTVVAIAAGAKHSMALCSDGTIAAWGSNESGRLGTLAQGHRTLPTEVPRNGALAGKTAVEIRGGEHHSLVLCSDGTLVAWGGNPHGQLGNRTTTSSSVPVAVSNASLLPGERFIRGISAAGHNLARVAVPLAPYTSTLAAAYIGDGGALLRGRVNPHDQPTSVSFEFGTTSALGTRRAAAPESLSGSSVSIVSLPVEDLLPGTTYHFRVVATSATGTTPGEIRSFTTSTGAMLAGLSSDSGTLSPGFQSEITRYSMTVSPETPSISLSATAVDPTANVSVNGQAPGVGNVSDAVPLVDGVNPITITVTVPGGTSLTYRLDAIRLPASFTFSSIGSALLESHGFDLRGLDAAFDLSFLPEPGTRLPVLQNNGREPILGTFGNLPQGAPVKLTHAGVDYLFTADYFGGDGNDLELRWANQRILAWGENHAGQLGDGTEAARAIPSPTDPDALLTGTAIRSISAGTGFSVALRVDGRMAAWGINDAGQLGNGGNLNGNRPQWVDTAGVLAGKTVIQVSCGTKHTLALCADGTLAAWGDGTSGQLGYGGASSSAVPVKVDQSGVLAGKRVVDIAAGNNQSLVLCDDGALIYWGSNFDWTSGAPASLSLTPRRLETDVMLDGIKLVEISAGTNLNSARSADGTLFSWGRDGSGSLGHFGNSPISPLLPFPVNATDALFGRKATAISSQSTSTLVLCSDGRLVRWGGSASSPHLPALIDASGVLADRSVEEVACGNLIEIARCADNTLVGWQPSGFTNITPALIDLTELKPQERLGRITAGHRHFLALVDSPPAPQAVTLAATDITDTTAVLRATVRPNGGEATIVFEYGPTPGHGRILAATPPQSGGSGEIEVSAVLTGLTAGSDYHFRVIVTSEGGTARGEELTFRTTDLTSLAGLSISAGTMSPAFDPRVTVYHAVVPFGIETISLTPQAKEAAAAVRVAGSPVASSTPSAPLPLAVGTNLIAIEVIAPGGGNSVTYQLTVVRLPASLVLDPSGDPSFSVAFLVPGDNPLPLALGFTPQVGTSFTLFEITGTSPISGRFPGLEDGQSIALEHDGAVYDFIVDYHGGDGNDLVLHWAHTRMLSWGYNFYGQLGTGTSGTSTSSAVALPVSRGGLLAGKTVTAIAGGDNHSLALCADGTLASWGQGTTGQLGRGPVPNSSSSSNEPVAVDQSGLLAEKTVVSIAAGTTHSLALCSDGTVAAWGGGGSGQLGNGTTTSVNFSPLAVDHSGVLTGRRVVGISARSNWSLAVCDDGRVAAWGVNNRGQLGNGSTNNSSVPVLVDASGVLAGKRVVAAAAGSAFGLALCSDGALVSWGDNAEGQLGIGTVSATGSLPVLVDRSGVLAGKTVIGVAAGADHCLVWCSDGTLAAWGANAGRLGDGTSGARSSTPVLVDRNAVLAGKQVVAMLANTYDSIALCDDGTIAHWGGGFNAGLSSLLPKALVLPSLTPDERVMRIGIGALHGMAVAAMPPPPRQVETLAATAVRDTSAVLSGRASGNGSTTPIRFEYGTTPALGQVLIPPVPEISGAAVQEISAPLEGLLPGTTYHFRLVAENAYGSAVGEIQTLTTTTLADLAGLWISPGSLAPPFSPSRLEYDVTLPADAAEIIITATAGDPAAGVTVAGVPASPGPVVPLVPDVTVVPIEVTSADALNRRVYQVTVTRLPASLDATSSPQVPVRAAGFSLAGDSPALFLGSAPAPGVPLMVLENTGPGMISGRFDNLAQNQTIYLSHGEIDYPYLVNYFGGSGNDLVLEWANTRLFAWGANQNGQLGDGTTTNRLLPSPVDASGPLAGRNIIDGGSGQNHSVVLTTDGRLFSWGWNTVGQLGTGGFGTGSSTTRPVAVDQSGALAGQHVVAVSVGGSHALALTAGGGVFGWGANTSGQLGDGSASDRNVPVATSMTGVLAGKPVVALATGGSHSLALCEDGTLAAWGLNGSGQLGNGTQVNSTLPVAVDQTGVLSRKRVIAIAAGSVSSYALCSDGTVVAWGDNSFGQLGDGSNILRLNPVQVRSDGVLAGKAVVAIKSGWGHVLVLCSDDTLASWGSNSGGSLGIGNNSNRNLPVLVNRSGVLAGKTIHSIHAAASRCFALCDDSTLAAWGNNGSGALGNNSTSGTNTPVAASMANLLPGESMVDVFTGSDTQSNLARIASPVPARATTLAASTVGDSGAVLQGSVNANGRPTTVTFEYGPTLALGSTAAATPATLNGAGAVPVSAALTDLQPGSTYHFRVVASGEAGIVRGEIQGFTTGNLATLASLEIDGGAIDPDFASSTTRYRTVVPSATESITVTAVTAYPGATIAVNGGAVASGAASAPVPLAAGDNEIRIVVTAADGASQMDYRIEVTRIPEIFTYRSAGDAGIRLPAFTASGLGATFALDYPPAPGTTLKVVELPGIQPIVGEFDNLAHGQEITLVHQGVSYHFVANYFGGDGNDLVMHWADTLLGGWGLNLEGQLGDRTTTNGLAPGPVEISGVLAGKTVTAVVSGYRHSLALCSDGTLAAWGRNQDGQLGDGTTIQRNLPVLVDRSGLLAGKTVVAIAAGDAHSLALCSDGSLFSWGSNDSGRLGNGSTANSPLPVAVVSTGALAGKRPVRISSAGASSLVLCADGTMCSWGANFSSQLGVAGFTGSWSDVPRLVDATGALADRQVIRIAAGANHMAVLCSDGALVAWGSQKSDLWGTGNNGSSVPTLVPATGWFAGRRIIDLSLGADHALALCDDQTIIAWGSNGNGRLGNNSTTSPAVPVLVQRTGILADRQVVRVVAREAHSLALCADGSVASWGINSYGELGNGSTAQSLVPSWVLPDDSNPAAPTIALSGGVGRHSLRIAGAPPAPQLATLGASEVADHSATLRAEVAPNGGETLVFFEIGESRSYGRVIDAVPAAVDGVQTVEIATIAGGLLPDTTYHYRAAAIKGGILRHGEDRTFTTTSEFTLDSLVVDGALLDPPFSKQQSVYNVTVGFATESLRITPTTTRPQVAVEVNGEPVVSGTSGIPIPLEVGSNEIYVSTVPGDGVMGSFYLVVVMRLPEVIALDSPDHLPIAAEAVLAAGLELPIQLNHAPPVGTDFTLLRATGTQPINGQFNDLADGRTIWLSHEGVDYPFVVNYRGGSGRDLILHWGNRRVTAWGLNGFGQLGEPPGGTRLKPIETLAPQGAILQAAAGEFHNLSLHADGTLYSWGRNSFGQLGRPAGDLDFMPAAVSADDLPAGKRIISIAVGSNHNLALVEDGTLLTWGMNEQMQLGIEGIESRSTPGRLTDPGALEGRRVTAIAAGLTHSLALCSDGTLAAWGWNSSGQLGDGTTTASPVPVAVDQSGALAGKTIVAIVAGANHSLALCDDGSLFAWGSNSHGQLGTGDTTGTIVPVPSGTGGALAGKFITAVSSGQFHTLALASDGTLAAWGSGSSGRLGHGSTGSSNVPVAVVTGGVLDGKTVVGIDAGPDHSLAWCADGTLVSWGGNNGSQLGNNTAAASNVPVLVDTGNLVATPFHSAASGGASHSLGLVAAPPPPRVETLAATPILGTRATLRGRAGRNGTTTRLDFEFGLTPDYGSMVSATPETLEADGMTEVSAVLDGLLPGTIYHFRMIASGAGGTVRGEDRTFTTSSLASLASLVADAGPLSPAFDPRQDAYLLTVPHSTAEISLTAELVEASATLSIHGQPASPGSAAGPFALAVGSQVIPLVVTVADGSFSQTYRLAVTRLPATLVPGSSSQATLSLPGLAADGIRLPLSLNHAPSTGATLRLIENTSDQAIVGRFVDLPQGGRVTLAHGGVDYPFFVNYHGGDGNDLVLDWANTRAIAWGNGDSGQLGDGLSQRHFEPVPVLATGALAGRTLIALAAGGDHSLGLCADGGVVSWGLGSNGRLGNGASTGSLVPVNVDSTGVLAGRHVIAISAGSSHSLALCADGTLATWGLNSSGQLGIGSLTASALPVAMVRSGGFANKSVVAISSGEHHNLALCADGTVFAWGANGSGQLGDGSSINSTVPKQIDMRAVHGQTPIIAVAAGGASSYALDANGIVSSWGGNSVGQLGSGNTTSRMVPGPLLQSGVLAGRRVIAVRAGTSHGLALCEDGVIAAWGLNTSGQLGDGTTTQRTAPVIVQPGSQFAGKPVAVIGSGRIHSLALASDGTLVGWGGNSFGQLADGSSVDRHNMVSSATTALHPAERFISVIGGSRAYHGLGLVAMPPAPRVETLAASEIGDAAATFHAEISGQGNPASVVFEYGPTPGYGFTTAATPSQVAGVNTLAVSARVTGLQAGSSYHFRVVATGPGGAAAGEDRVFTTGVRSALASLEILPGTLTPSFTPANIDYRATLPYAADSISLRPIAATAGAVIRVNGDIVDSGTTSPPVAMAVGENQVSAVVTSADGSESSTYLVSILRLPAQFAFSTPDDGAFNVAYLAAQGELPPVRLLSPPDPGVRLTLIHQSGHLPISGRFSNLEHGETIHIDHGGVVYAFVANYFGGDGNDLVLHWANTRPFAFGANNQGQLGNGSFIDSALPVAVATSGALRGRTVLAVSAGRLHNLAVLEDGSIASWGYNESGILGDGATSSQPEPVMVNRQGVLADRTVVAVAAGYSHSMALCSDGTLAAWGSNNYGQLGNASRINSTLPVRIDQSGVLAGRRVIAVAAGLSHSLALCSDGRVAAWGRNQKGQLGSNTGLFVEQPVWVDQSGVLTGKTVVAIAAGSEHSVALCSDGTLAAWGANNRGQIGDNGSIDSGLPVRVRVDLLAGRTVVGIRSHALHNLALCSDGSLFAWGANSDGRLGIGGTIDARMPTLVATGGSAVDADAGEFHSIAVLADGKAAAWGNNGNGRLGNGSNIPGQLPGAVATGALQENSRAIAGAAGENYSLLLAALPPAPVVVTHDSIAQRDRSAILRGEASSNGPDADVWFELGTDPDFLDRRIPATPAQAIGSTSVAVEVVAAGLSPGTTYHYRLVASNERGETLGKTRSFTTTTLTTLASLVPDHGLLGPDFHPSRSDYRLTLPHAADALTLTPTAAHPSSSITVNGAPATSGSASAGITIPPGDSVISVEVTSPDGLETTTYQIRTTRLPASLRFDSVEGSLITASDFSAAGVLLDLSLGFTPAPGARLRLLTLTGPEPLIGSFTNLPHGSIVGLDHEGSTYHFVVNYYGGNGNDLELRWLNSRVVAWGSNAFGQFGSDSASGSQVPAPADMTGVLERNPVIQLAGNTSNTTPFAYYSMALSANGTLAGWGRRETSQSFGPVHPDSRIPLAMDATGPLAGKSLASISAGSNFSLFLAGDGTLAASGSNGYGALGDGGLTSSAAPVAVLTSGALRGKRVVAISAGLNHSLALCSDGTVAAWGRNQFGELGIGSAATISTPILVKGLPDDHRVVAVSAGNAFSLALLENGTVLAWGFNGSGQLGIGGDQFQNESSPVPVDRSGVLAGKRVIAISAGANHSLALSDDGMVCAWGSNADGRLGNGSTTTSPAPVEVSRAGPLNNRSVIAISAMHENSLALCSDGTLAAWGANLLLGNTISGSRSEPIAVSTETLRPGELFMDINSGMNSQHALALTALPLPSARTLAASSVTGVSASLHGIVNARGNDTAITIEYGREGNFDNSVTATPATASGDVDSLLRVDIAGLTPGTRYDFRIVADCYGGITRSAAMSFTTLSDNARLADIVNRLSNRRPAFAPETFHYIASVDFDQDDLEMRPVTEHPGATVVINGIAVPRGDDSPRFPLAVGGNTLEVVVTAEDGITTLSYTTVVTRLPEFFDLTPGAPPVTAAGFSANWRNAPLRLGFHPPVGTSLTVVENTSLSPIHGEFENLKQGQRITLGFDGVDHDFIANYYGGSGNDLVLQWADNFVAAWGLNNHGQLGNGGTLDQAVPVVAERADGKTVFAVAAGYLHSVALLHDGTLAAWGYNVQGQLGLGHQQPSQVATPVVSGGALAGKTVVAIAAGAFHNLALCGDGTVVSWGSNNHGQLGTGDRVMRNAPVVVEPVGALAGKRVVAVAAGYYHSLALCDDGSVTGWGYNDEGELGNGGTTTALIPVAVDVSGSLAGKSVSRIAAGQYHSLALCTDGTLVAWGYNGLGQIGDGTTTDRHSPVEVDLTGAAGRIAAGGSHSLVELVDGTLWGWGDNSRGQLAAGLGERITMPQVLAAGPGRGFSCGALHSLSVRDGERIDVWGDARAATAAVVSATGGGFTEGSRFVSAASGASAFHHLAIIAVPNPVGVPALAAWREWHFGTAANEGEAADCEDCDRDGIPNLVEYAFGLDPNADNSGQLPQPRLVGDRLELRFKRTLIKPDVEIGAEWSPDLQPGSWQAVPDSGGGDEALFSLPLDAAPRLFMRIKVTPTQSP